MRISLFAVLLSFILLHMQAQNHELSSLLPRIPDGWQNEGETTVYDQNTLYDYINGGAELYNSYGMNEVISQKLVDGNNNEIRIEIFDMVKAKNAFGVFSHTRTEDENEFGQGSQYFTGAQIFWKDKYLVSVVATDENENILSAIKMLAGDINNNITQEGDLPSILKELPEKGLLKDGYVYFNHYIWLNSYYFIADENIFYVDNSTNAVLAKYGPAEERYFLLLVEYSDGKIADKALLNYQEAFMEKETDKSLIRIEDNTWTGYTRNNNMLACVFNCPSEKAAMQLLNAVFKRKP